MTAPTDPAPVVVHPGDRPTGPGCADVWGSPSVDLEQRLVFVGTGNCTATVRWGAHSEAILVLDLDSAVLVVPATRAQPRRPRLRRRTQPVRRRRSGRCRLGQQGRRYYAVDRETGEALWDTRVAEPGIPEPGSDYSTGGFIGPTKLADGVVVGGTPSAAPPTCTRSMPPRATCCGSRTWPGPTYAAAAEANGVVFIGGTDFTFRALDLRDGDVLGARAERRRLWGCGGGRRRRHRRAAIRAPVSTPPARTAACTGSPSARTTAPRRRPRPPRRRARRRTPPPGHPATNSPWRRWRSGARRRRARWTSPSAPSGWEGTPAAGR